MTSRTYFGPILQELEKKVSIATYNDVLIQALQQDLQKFRGKSQIPRTVTDMGKVTISEGVGVFYVFAGSAMGARLLLKQIKDTGLDIPTNYLDLLATTSTKQLTVLKGLLRYDTLDDAAVIRAARQTFDFIYNTG